MKTINKIVMIFLLATGIVSCSIHDDSTTLIIVPPAPEIKDMVIPSDMLPTLSYTISGRGFYVGDTLILRTADNNAKTEGDFKAKSVASAFNIQFTVPAGCAGDYDFCLLRNKEIYDLGETLTIAESFTLDDVGIRSQYLRSGGTITVTSPNMMNGDSIVISQNGKSIRVDAKHADLGSTKSLTFKLPEEFDDGTEILGAINLSVYRVTLTTFACTAQVVKELPYKVGDALGGGVVFANDPMTLDAWVVSLKYSSGIPWGPVWEPQYEVGTTKWEFGSGEANTAAIIEKQGSWNDGNYSAKYCADYSVESNGTTYDDWFLPSADEALALYNSHNQINGKLVELGGDRVGPAGTPGATHFHTSTETNGYNYAVFIVIDQNPVTYVNGKNFGVAVRPVRIHKYVP